MQLCQYVGCFFFVVDQILFQTTLLTAQIVVNGRAGLSGPPVALSAKKGVKIEREEGLLMIACQDLFVVGDL